MRRRRAEDPGGFTAESLEAAIARRARKLVKAKAADNEPRVKALEMELVLLRVLLRQGVPLAPRTSGRF